mgnify:CR=1
GNVVGGAIENTNYTTGIVVTAPADSGQNYSAIFKGSSNKGLFIRDDGNVDLSGGGILNVKGVSINVLGDFANV